MLTEWNNLFEWHKVPTVQAFRKIWVADHVLPSCQRYLVVKSLLEVFIHKIMRSAFISAYACWMFADFSESDFKTTLRLVKNARRAVVSGKQKEYNRRWRKQNKKRRHWVVNNFCLLWIKTFISAHSITEAHKLFKCILHWDCITFVADNKMLWFGFTYFYHIWYVACILSDKCEIRARLH